MDNSDVHHDQPLRERVLALFSLSLDPLPFHLPSFFLPSGTQVTLFSSGPESYFCVSDFIVTNCPHPPDSRSYRKTFQRSWCCSSELFVFQLCLNSLQFGLFPPVLLSMNSVAYFSVPGYHLVSFDLSGECDRPPENLWSLSLHDVILIPNFYPQHPLFPLWLAPLI